MGGPVRRCESVYVCVCVCVRIYVSINFEHRTLKLADRFLRNLA